MNKRSRYIVGSLPHYRIINEHASVNIFLKTGAARYTTISQLYATLCLRNCELCGELGNFVYLLSCTRCCLVCLRAARFRRDSQMLPRFDTVTLAMAAKRRGLYVKALRSMVPTLRIPSRMQGNKSVLEVVDESHVLGKVIRCFNPRTWKCVSTAAATVLPYYDESIQSINRGMQCKGCRLAVEKSTYEYHDPRIVFADRDRIYFHGGFLEHFKWCKSAQDVWGGVTRSVRPCHSFSKDKRWW